MTHNNKSNSDSIKEDLKKKIKEKLKKELLEEIYTELKSEENSLTEEVMATLNKKFPESHSLDEKGGYEENMVKENAEDTFKGLPADCTITVKAILKVASHALKYANKNIPKSEWVEVIGLLAGQLDKRTKLLCIKDAYPMGHGNAVYAEIKDYNNYVRAFKDIKKTNCFICGWYHSHPTYGTFMSTEDLQTQARYQKLWDDAVALVVDPYEIDGSSYGFNIFRSNLKTQEWFPLTYTIDEEIDTSLLPKLLEFINPIIDGKAIFLEYDEE
ncbi:MAG: hypothetical protein GF317_06640 [Candidatus Lokiarchaeota archaeon]|nr:hypothetical protein [Candidatus Lokiarchaeota archaeon]MBD3199391.1 hypothetical protein [Candidatus Lokiarchaeota archaeon]